MITRNTTLSEIIHHPLLEDFGMHIFPMEYGYRSSLKLQDVGSLLPFHGYIRTETTIDVIESLLSRRKQNEQIFYPIYTKEEMQRDPSKSETSLFYFRQCAGNVSPVPFAVVCAGGGFCYVGSIHESLPHALELSRRGYAGFALRYRIGSAYEACEDLATALSYIFAHATELGVSTDCYSLWGGSAGARVAAYLGSYHTHEFGGDRLPRPGAVIMQYTGHSEYTQNDPPTFACIGDSDRIASPRVMQRRIQVLQSLGIDAEFHLYPQVGHGFGLGLGTSAEGWIDDAIIFWERQLSRIDRRKTRRFTDE